MNAAEVIKALRYRHPLDAWVFFDELRVGTGFGGSLEQRIDAWAMHCWPTKGYRRVAYEVKVSKSDMKHELDTPSKRKAALMLSNEFYWAIPEGLDVPLLPAEAGLIVVNADGKAQLARKAPYRDVASPPISFWASVARRAVIASKGGGKSLWELTSHNKYGVTA